jgi:hypothetical protein
MKQLKLKNARLQKLADSIHGWKEVALLVITFVALAIAVLIATKVSAM